MVLQVRPVTLEDVPSLTNVHYEATTPNYLTKLLFGDANPQELRDFMMNSFGKSVKNESNPDSTTRYLVAVDSELGGEIIAWAHWVIPHDEVGSGSAGSSEDSSAKKVQEEGDKPADYGTKEVHKGPDDQKTQEEKAEDTKYPKGLNASLQTAFMTEITSLREKCLKGRKHWILRNLATHPSHERRGAATLLVQWPFEQADREGEICYLDTALNGAGRNLYERNGFVMVGRCDLDLKPFGGDHVHTHIGMIREPQ